MKRFVGGLLLCAVVGVATIAVVVMLVRLLPATNDPLETYTLWLTVCTGLLGAATVGLVVVAYRQFHDSRLNNRAYISIEPLGISPWRDTTSQFLAHIGVLNAGVLPARSLKWLICLEMTNDGDRQNFSIGRDRRGSQLVVGGATMRRGSPPIDTIAKNYCFVWGIVEYDDGFGRTRSTKFCHRYNCKLSDFVQLRTVPAESARQHEYGNYAD